MLRRLAAARATQASARRPAGPAKTPAAHRDRPARWPASSRSGAPGSARCWDARAATAPRPRRRRSCPGRPAASRPAPGRAPKLAHARVDQPFVGADHRDDLVEQHGGARLGQRRHLSERVRMALGAVEHAVDLRARRGTPASPGAEWRSRHAAPARVRCAARRWCRGSRTARRRLVGSGEAARRRASRARRPARRPKSAGAQRQNVGQPDVRPGGARAVEADHRDAPVGDDAQLAGDASTSTSASAQPEQLLHPHRVRRRRRGQSRDDPGCQHRGAAQHLVGVVGQRPRALLHPDRSRESRGRARRPGWWIPTARRGRRPSSGRSATRTTSPLARSASKMPLADPVRCSGGPARPRIDSRRSSSASSLDAE